MEKKLPKKTKYRQADKQYWEGRKSTPDKGNQYWHEAVQLASLDQLDQSSIHTKIGLLGYQCDEGVRRNQGRVGAKAGPNALRERLAKLPIHFSKKHVYDFGNLDCPDKNLEACQELLAQSVCKMLQKNIIPIVIGGGHDVAYGHFKGIDRAFAENKRIGIINFDAHFDLRPVDKAPNSGTPFNQIFSEFDRNRLSYLVIGIQQQGNTKELFEIARDYDVTFIPHDVCNTSKSDFNNLKSSLDKFMEGCDAIYISVDMDGFSSAYAPGVSAPSPLGFTPDFFFKAMAYIMESKKTISYDIAELNPKFDIDNHTASLAARIVDFMVCNIW